MAGQQLNLKPGQVLFKEGEASDGMFLVRNGELKVYLEQGGHEVELASVTGGGMIGEMALFDKKPRSASVKAVSNAEVTQITNDDFAKLMKQIPKWFTALMITLSGRLRVTNERLQKMETRSSGERQTMQSILRITHVMELILQRDGIKEGKGELPRQMTLLVSYKSRDDLICWRELQEAAQQPGVRVIATLSREEAEGFWHGRIDQDMVARAVEGQYGETTFMTCGPEGLMSMTSEHLAKAGVAAEHIRYESFDN